MAFVCILLSFLETTTRPFSVAGGVTMGIVSVAAGFQTMQLFEVYRIKKDFCGLELKTGLIDLTGIPLKYSGMTWIIRPV